jgi:NADH-ubiquinone oxidoreductase chain 2
MPKIAITMFLLELYSHLPVLINDDSINNLIISVPHFMTGLKESIVSGQVIKYLLLLSSLLSLILGTIVGLAQTKIKRLLAYSTVSHVGFLLLALAINSEKSIDALIFYLIQYSITSLNTFLIIIAFGYIIYAYLSAGTGIKLNSNKTKGYVSNDIIFISQLKGQFFYNPLLTLSLVICLFSMAGVPPLIGFFSKQFVLYSAIQNGYNFMAIVAIIVSVISASYYLKIVKVLFSEAHALHEVKTNQQLFGFAAFGPVEGEDTVSMLPNPDKNETSTNIKLENTKLSRQPLNIKNNIAPVVTMSLTAYHSLLISILTMAIILFILKPSILLNLTQLLSLSLFYT